MIATCLSTVMRMQGTRGVLVGLVALIGFVASCGSASRPLLPSGWKSVSYRGVAIGVPAAWPVYPRSSNALCSFSGPGVVLVGPLVLSAEPGLCGEGFPLIKKAEVVTIGGPGTTYLLGQQKTRDINGVIADVSSGVVGISWGSLGSEPMVRAMSMVRVIFPDRNVWVSIEALGTNRNGFGEQVVSTIHPVSPSRSKSQ